MHHQITTLWLPLLLFALLAQAASVVGRCKVPECTSNYEDSIEEEKIVRASSVAFCQVLVDYGSCLKKTAKDCRGDIIYLSSNAAVRKLLKDFNCSTLIGLDKLAPEAPRPRPSIIPELPPNEIIPATAAPRCQFHGSGRYSYCGLFGDPHLKTFSNSYQTCRVRGAWPLIDNPYVAVQVTNDPVLEGSPATVTTKVTVIIKSRGTFCVTEKTYEATSDAPLPATFVDGSRTAGENVELTLQELDVNQQSVEIHLKYIKTTLVVRQVGKYLAFAAQLPVELSSLPSGDNNLQLCDSGCPLSERLDLSQAHGTVMSWDEALALCRDASQLNPHISNNLTDYYLDWCVFDLMTTGAAEANAFVTAAHSAQADALRFEPDLLTNRTEPHMRPRAHSAAPLTLPVLSNIFAWLIVTAALRLLF